VLWLAIIAVAFTMLGAALLISGWRGERIDDHPLCRKCGFDLVGKPPDAIRCPECGTDSATRLPRKGHRRCSVKSIFGGVFIFVLGAAPLIAWAVILCKGIDPQSLKPVWWLQFDLRSRSQPVYEAACGELGRRLENGRLTQTDVDAVVTTLLKMQADRAANWDYTLQMLFDELWRTGLLSPQQVDQYRRNALSSGLVVRVRRRVDRGDPLSVEISTAGMRGGPIGWNMMPLLQQVQILADIDGTPISLNPTGDNAMLNLVDNSVSDTEDLWLQNAIPTLDDGAHTIHFKFVDPPNPDQSAAPQALLSSISAPFDLLPAGAATAPSR
jgi:hypothetical protein